MNSRRGLAGLQRSPVPARRIAGEADWERDDRETRERRVRRKAKKRGYWLVSHGRYDETADKFIYTYNLVGIDAYLPRNFRSPTSMVFDGVDLDKVEEWLWGRSLA
jgi:hypothetical protein